MASMLQRWGWLRRRKGRSVLCLQLGPEDAEGEPWAPLFKALTQRFPRLRCYSYGLAKGTPLGTLPGPEAWPRLLLRAKAHGVFLSGGPSPPGLAEACLALSLPLFEAAPGGAWNAPEGAGKAAPMPSSAALSVPSPRDPREAPALGEAIAFFGPWPGGALNDCRTWRRFGQPSAIRR